MTEVRRQRWVVTGPIAAGKSSVTEQLARAGASVIDADIVAHGVLREAAVRDRLREEFGDGVFIADEIDRRRLGRIVFNDEAAMARLNSIVHPTLARRLDDRFEGLEKPAGPASAHLAVLEAAVYFQLPIISGIDLVICVSAPLHVRRRRLEAAGLTADEALARMDAQRHLVTGWKRADLTLENDGDPAALAAAVADILKSRGPI